MNNHPANHSIANQPEDSLATNPRPGNSSRTMSPQIWVGSLADYNNGDLHGQWLDAAREPEEIHADIQAMLARGPAARRGEAPEEWGIFDYEDFGSLRLGEYESIEDVARLAAGIVEHGPAFAAWAEATERDKATVRASLRRTAGISTPRLTMPSSWWTTSKATSCSSKRCRNGCSHTSRSTTTRSPAIWSLVATSLLPRLKTEASTYITQFNRGLVCLFLFSAVKSTKCLFERTNA